MPLALWDGNPREIGRLVWVVRLSTLTGHWEDIIQISSVCFIVVEFIISAMKFLYVCLSFIFVSAVFPSFG